MMYAYDESYLDRAMKNLGEAFDYAVYACNLTLHTFMDLFISSGCADLFQKGNPKYIAGLSGTELVMEIISKSGLEIIFPESQTEFDYSPEYWCGWILAYYQWTINKSFKAIINLITIDEICSLYHPLHEASEEKFVDVVNEICKRRQSITNLQKHRKLVGLSQRELSEKTGVNLRTLQQYEIGSKDLNKAAVETIMALANALGCRIEDIL